MNKDIILKEVWDEYEWMVEKRRHFHMNPETGFDVIETRKYVENELTMMGYNPIRCGKMGLKAVLGKEGRAILLRADMDAIPVREESDVDFYSENGKMHGCGHDMHMAMLLGAAKILKKYEDKLEGQIVFMFQPAEEILEGAKDMVDNGVLENPKVAAAVMLHVLTAMPFKTGTIIVPNAGVTAPAADMFKVEIKGKGCHGASPHTGVDPILIAANLVNLFQGIQTREIPAIDGTVVTIGRISGGTTANVIPDRVEMEGSIRTWNEDSRKHIKKRMVEVVNITTNMFGGEGIIHWNSGCRTFINNEELLKSAKDNLKELLGDDRVILAEDLTGADRTGGSEDFSYVSWQVPTIMLSLSAGSYDEGYQYQLHHPKVRFDEVAMKTGAATLIHLANIWTKK